MIDYFSEQLTTAYLRCAVFFGAFIGVVQIVLGVLSARGVSWWSVAEGVIVIALAYGVWRRNLASAVVLVILKVTGSALWWSQNGHPPDSTATYQVVLFTFAAAAIYLGKPLIQQPVIKTATTISGKPSDDRPD